MSEIATFAPIETLAVAALSSTAPTSTKVPNPRPATPFLRVMRAGGKRDRFSELANLVVEAWAADSVTAEELAQDARTALFALVGEDVLVPALGRDVFVRSVEEVGGIQDFPDPVSGSPRFVFTVQLSTRGVATP